MRDFPISFGMLRPRAGDFHDNLIRYLERLPEPVFFRVVEPGKLTLAEAIINCVQHDYACLEALDEKSEIGVPPAESMATREKLIVGLKLIEARKLKVCGELTDADLDRELNIVHAHDPKRRGTVRDMVEALINILGEHCMEIGLALKRLGLADDLRQQAGLKKGVGPEELN